MNDLSLVAIAFLALLVGYWACPFASHWWRTKRPAKCPACRRWVAVGDMVYVRHNSGMAVRICVACRDDLYASLTRGKQ
jgi:hypothetical protein